MSFCPEVWGLGKRLWGRRELESKFFPFLDLQSPILHSLPREVLILHSPTQMPPPVGSLPIYSQAKLIIPMARDKYFNLAHVSFFLLAWAFLLCPLPYLIHVYIFRVQPRSTHAGNNQYTSACVVLKIVYKWESQRSDTQELISSVAKAAVSEASKNSAPTNRTVSWEPPQPRKTHIFLPLRRAASHYCLNQKGVNIDIFLTYQPP